MASPEVERPITSPSNPVLSPHGLSPGNAGPAATRPSPGSSTSRKVVTFDHGLSASVDVDRKSIPPSSHYHSAKHKFNKHGYPSNTYGFPKHSSYSNKYRHHSHKTFCHALANEQQKDLKSQENEENEEKVVAKDGEKLLPHNSSLIVLPSQTNTQTKRFRGGGIRKRSYSFSEGNVSFSILSIYYFHK